jgi:acyl carrier protein
MNSDELRPVVLHALHLVAPEFDLEQLNPDAPLRHELEIDSLDFLRFIQQLHRALGIDIPENDYSSLNTLNSCLDYLHLRDREREGSQ